MEISDTVQVLSNPRLFLLYYMSMNNILVTESGELLDKFNRSFSQVVNSMMLDYNDLVLKFKQSQNKLPPQHRAKLYNFNPFQLQMCLSELISKEKVTFRAKTVEQFKCISEDTSNVVSFVESLNSKNLELDIAVILHWICSVKRKLIGIPVYNHILPVLVGLQGTGKTIALNRLLEPLKAYQLNLSLEQIVDQRFIQSLSENYVCFLDELSAYSAKDLESLKNVVTANTISGRTLGTNRVETYKQACSFIAASNKPINQTIKDTAMRRFYQITITKNMDWEKLNNIDFDALWKGVDESKDYITQYLYRVREEQEKLSTKDLVNLFILENSLIPMTEFNIPVSAKQLYKQYQLYCIENGFSVINSIAFGKKLHQYGLESINTKDANQKTITAYKCNPLNCLFQEKPKLVENSNG